jgi:RimJ/RimL family protein N-acetyltransferase
MDVIIREAQPADAAQLVAYVQHIIEEPGINVELSPGEFTPTVAEEREILAQYALSDNSLYLLAETGGEIVGVLICKGGTRQATRHAVTLGGMSVAQEWRRRGIGTQLLARAIEWAKGTGIVTRIELSVFEPNRAAIELYRKFGFVVEARRRRAVFRDGQYWDDWIMARLL